MPSKLLLLAFLALGLTLRAETPARPADLLTAETLNAWELVAQPAAAVSSVCTPVAGGAFALAGKPTGYVATKASYEDYRLHVEWRWTDKPGNGGILLHIASGPKDRQWPLSFQVQAKHQAVGDLLPMAGGTFAEPLTSAPGAAVPLRAHAATDSEKPAGEWNTCDIVCRGDTIEVSINGVAQNRVTRCSPRAGRIGFQFEGTPFELRNVRLEPLPPDPALTR